MNSFEFSTVAKLICAPGSMAELPVQCRALGIHRPMLVSDEGLVSAGVVATAVNALQSVGIDPLIYTDIESDPPEEIVLKAVETARENKIDGVLGIGGGSSLDVAKLIAVVTPSSQALSAMYGINNVQGKRLPLILAPTTAGTGSEVTQIAIVTTGATTKSGVVSPQLMPDIAILDAELTLGLPAHITAATGIDAMVHAIEAYTSKVKKNYYSDMLAREALSLLSANILKAVEHGDNLTARHNMLLGAMLAGQAFANAPVAAVHALAYPLGGNYHIPHGLSNSLVLPHVLRFNAQVAASRYAELLSCVATPQTKSLSGDDCEKFIRVIDELITATNLPKHLSELDVPQSDLERLADEAMEQQRLLINNPREVSRGDALEIYQAAY